MSEAIWWWVFITVLSVAVLGVFTLAERTWGPGRLKSPRAQLQLLVAGLVALLVVGLLLRSSAIADADAHLVRALARFRGEGVTTIFSILTTTGDGVPSFLLAAVLALVLYRQSVHGWWPWILPVVVLVQLSIQFLMGHVVGSLTIAEVAGDLQVGEGGYLPSGAVARLTSMALITALFWKASTDSSRRRVVTTGLIVVVAEATTRIYLGRHLLLDIVGGLLLGLALFLAVSLLVRVGGVGAVEESYSSR